MKKYILILLTIISLFAYKVNAITQPSEGFYVNDYANVLTLETKNYIMEKSVAMHENIGTQIVVVTIDKLENESIETHASKLFNNWKVGSRENKDGLLILLSVKDKKIEIKVGNKLQEILPKKKVGRIKNKIITPYLKKSNWNEAVKSGYDAIYNEIIEPSPINKDLRSITLSEIIIYSLIGIGLGVIEAIIILKLQKKHEKIAKYIYLTIFLLDIILPVIIITKFLRYEIWIIPMFLNLLAISIYIQKKKPKSRYKGAKPASNSKRYYSTASHYSSSRSNGSSKGS